MRIGVTHAPTPAERLSVRPDALPETDEETMSLPPTQAATHPNLTNSTSATPGLPPQPLAHAPANPSSDKASPPLANTPQASPDPASLPASPGRGEQAKGTAQANIRMSNRVPTLALQSGPPKAMSSGSSSASSVPPISKRSASFILKPQPIPKSPRTAPTSARAVKKEDKSASQPPVTAYGSSASSASTASTASTSAISSASTPNIASTSGISSASAPNIATPPDSSTSATAQSSEPVLRRIRARSQVEVPTRMLEKVERNYVPNLLANLIVDDVIAGEILADQLHKVGRIDSAFYLYKLPPELQPLAKSSIHSTISSSKLMQALFAEDFRANKGWLEARAIYAAAATSIDTPAPRGKKIDIGTVDPELKAAIREKLKGRAEVIVRSLLGHPASLKNSPLPERLIDYLVHCDQRFHMKLMQGERTCNFSSSQMRDARIALQKQLLVTYLLQPMLSGLAQARPSQSEIWFLSLLMSSLLKALPPLHDEVFARSFGTSPKRFQEAVTSKHAVEEKLEKMEKLEKQRQRTEQRKATFKSRPGHVRSRSADTTLIDLRSLPTREEVMQKRAEKKRSEALANEVDGKVGEFENVLKDAEKNVEEHEKIRKAHADLQEFNADDLQLVLDILNDRDGDIEILDALDNTPDPQPARAVPLGEADDTTTANTLTSPDNTTTANIVTIGGTGGSASLPASSTASTSDSV